LRTRRTPGDLGGDAYNRVGKKTADQLAEKAQQDFLSQNTDEVMSLFGKQGQIEGTDLVPRAFAKIDEPFMVGQKGQMSMLLPPEAPPRPVRPDVANVLDPRRSNDIKGALDDAINYARNPLSKDPAKEQALYAARRAISGKIDNQIESLGGTELLGDLKAANKDYGLAAQVQRTANDRAQREAANRVIGLTDTIAGAGFGGASMLLNNDKGDDLGLLGAGLGFALGAGANKLGRTYGNAVMAKTADNVAKFLLRSPQMQQLATRNPAAFKAAINGGDCFPVSVFDFRFDYTHDLSFQPIGKQSLIDSRSFNIHKVWLEDFPNIAYASG
jgi:hypothetical protein